MWTVCKSHFQVSNSRLVKMPGNECNRDTTGTEAQKLGLSRRNLDTWQLCTRTTSITEFTLSLVTTIAYGIGIAVFNKLMLYD